MVTKGRSHCRAWSSHSTQSVIAGAAPSGDWRQVSSCDIESYSIVEMNAVLTYHNM